MAGQFILLDIGGTYIKSAHTDSAGSLRNVRRFPIPDFLSTDKLLRELASDEISASCAKAVNVQLDALDTKPLGILVSGQMAGYAIGNQTNSIEGNIVSWQDLRVEEEIDGINTWEWAQEGISTDVKKAIGNEYRQNLPLLNIVHRLRTGELKNVNTPKFNSLLWWALEPLIQNPQFIAHITDAAASGLFDIHSFTWFQDAFTNWGYSLDFPKVSNDLEPIGQYMNTSIPVYSPVGDQQASLLGTGITTTNTIVNIGTGGQVARLLENHETSNDFPDAQIRPFFDAQQLITATHLPSGRAFASAVRAVTNGNDSHDFEMFREMSLSTGEIEKLPLEKFPYDFELVSSLVTELGQEKIARSFLHQLVDTYSCALEKIGFSSFEHSLTFAGGVGQKFPEFTQLLAERNDSRVSISNSEETTLEGLTALSRGF